MKIAAYMSISTEEQTGEERYSLRAQLADIKRLCTSRRYVIMETYRDTISGATSDRPGFQQMISDAQNHLFDAVVVAKLDRLGRSPAIQLMATDELEKLGLQVIPVAEPMGEQDQDTARLVRSVIAASSEFERSRMNSRMSAGRREKAKTGGYSGGPPQFGYVSRDHYLVVDVSQAQIVKKVFAWRSLRWTLQEIADELNKECTTRRGKKWQPRQVSRILQHRGLYRGRYAYGNIETRGRHEAILR
jgi:DNA invertase Pin-like site-specific DNA recombinase